MSTSPSGLSRVQPLSPVERELFSQLLKEAASAAASDDSLLLVRNLDSSLPSTFAVSVGTLHQLLSEVDAITFNIAAPEPTTDEGILWYDSENHTLSLRTENEDVTVQLGQELQVRVKNNNGVPILNGQALYLTGVDAGVPTVALADASDPDKSLACAVATADIPVGEVGRATTFGLVRDLDTSAFNVGDHLYLSPTTPGAYVTAQPNYPNTVSFIGRVLVKDAANGVIMVTAPLSSVILDQRYSTTILKGWGFGSPSGTFGTFYAGGYYLWGPASDDFDPAVTLGTANVSYAAHVSFVLGGVTSDELTLRVTGTSITDAAVRTAADTEDIVIPAATPVDSYFETTKKWLGQVTISVVSGTPVLCNYGWSKYWDDNNTKFRVLGVEAVWIGGAADAAPNLSIIHHKTTGWTYGAGGTPTPPYIARMNTDHVTEVQVGNGLPGAWKRTDLDTLVDGAGSEGILIEIVTSANKTFDVNSNINLTLAPET